jgi:hypothetical protein
VGKLKTSDLEKMSHVDLLKIYRELDDEDEDDVYVKELVQDICEKRRNMAFPRLSCCPEMVDSASIVFRASIFSDNKLLGWFVVRSNSHQPELQGSNHFDKTRHPAKFCPYCGKGVPTFRRKQAPPEPIVKSLGDQYCGTCKERLGNCLCLTEEAAYEVVV